MQKFYLLLTSIAILVSVLTTSCGRHKRPLAKSALDPHLQGSINQRSNLPFDSVLIIVFFQSYPELKKYQEDVTSIYREQKFNHIWFDNKGVVEFGNALYNKSKNLELEGISSVFPYQDKINGVFEDEIENQLTKTETELMLTSLFLYYSDKVYKGLDEKTTSAMGWLLPRKQLSYNNLLDSLLTNSDTSNPGEKVLFGQYFKLRAVLQQYREIEKTGLWKPIDLDPKVKVYKRGDTAQAIRQIRERLFITGDIKKNDSSNRFDTELVAAIKNYQLRNGKNPTSTITPKLINELNVPIGELIMQIMVNMERCRWISPEIVDAKEMIFVNIPSYKLNFYRNGISELESPVVVGKNITKTVIFGGKMSYIVFSPYWNLPQSIINKEVKPGLAKDPNYLVSHDMEWNNGQVRQKPGKKNSLGLVKFMFPNSNDIYLHDTPSKSLFDRESRAFSHGCVRVGKARDLAISILKDDPDWTPKKIDAAMHANKESICLLKNKIPVYIGYFTAWVNEKGEIEFYDDIYERDENLANLMIDNQ